MIDRIDNKLCNGCGICAHTCPMDVIRMDEKAKKAKIAYPNDCTSCAMCEKDCPKHAIYISPFEYRPYPTSFGV
ncbi:MAG: 4Fe-4S binding protein [Dehalococcoidales bacterium]|nr:4Fe-4S binding protein [Dehalococcoidales bacterium]